MLRILMITSSALALMAGGVLAADQTEMSDKNKQQAELGMQFDQSAELVMASNFLGMTIYSGEGAEAEQIGEVNDVVLDSDGEIAAVIVEVGGFLGIGEKRVAIEFDRLSWSEQDGERRLTASLERAELENAPAFDRTALRVKDETRMDQAEATEEIGTEERMAAGELEGQVETRPQAGEEVETYDSQTTAGTIEAVDPSTLNTDQLLGTAVFGTNDENLGEIGDLILSDTEKVEAYIVNVGGFLGIGQKPVAIDATDFQILRDEHGRLFVRTPFTAEQMENQPEYTEEAYQQDRDSIVMRK
jgi:sporulation protein YlmC with PRC-barrel domain